MFNGLGMKIILSVWSYIWCTVVVILNPACKRCVHTVYSVGEKSVIKILLKLLFDYLYTMDLINARNVQHVKIEKIFD